MPSRSATEVPGSGRKCRTEVILCGRVAAAAEERELPSGDTIMTARIIVDRDTDALSRSAQRVDTLDCVAWTARVQRSIRTWSAGQPIEVHGSVRRRFFRGPAGAASRVEIEVKSTRRLPT